MVKPEDCSRYESCNANICPLDREWRRRSHLSGEPVCFWLRERSKEGWEARLRDALPTNQLMEVSQVWSEITSAALGSRHGIVASVLRRAALGGSKLAAGKARVGQLRNQAKGS